MDQEDSSDLDAAIDGELPETPESLRGDTEDLDPGVPSDDCYTLHVQTIPGVPGDDQVQVRGRGEVTLGRATVRCTEELCSVQRAACKVPCRRRGQTLDAAQ